MVHHFSIATSPLDSVPRLVKKFANAAEQGTPFSVAELVFQNFADFEHLLSYGDGANCPHCGIIYAVKVIPHRANQLRIAMDFAPDKLCSAGGVVPSVRPRTHHLPITSRAR
jgi:hypothetical protein